MSDVLIVGAGPTGLTLACDLARRGVGVRIVDKSPDHPRSSRSKGPNARSLEVLEDLGVVRAVLEAGSAPLPMRKYRDGVPVADADPYADSVPTPDAPYDRGRLIAQWRLEEILTGVGLFAGADGTHAVRRYLDVLDGAARPDRTTAGGVVDGAPKG